MIWKPSTMAVIPREHGWSLVTRRSGPPAIVLENEGEFAHAP